MTSIGLIPIWGVFLEGANRKRDTEFSTAVQHRAPGEKGHNMAIHIGTPILFLRRNSSVLFLLARRCIEKRLHPTIISVA